MQTQTESVNKPVQAIGEIPFDNTKNLKVLIQLLSNMTGDVLVSTTNLP